MFTRAKKILCSEMMYALEMDEEKVDAHLTGLLLDAPANRSAAAVASAPSSVG